MNSVFDASCIINLFNGDSLEAVLSLNEFSFFIGPIVKSECITNQEEITNFINKNELTEIGADEISGGLFLQLLQQHKLGEGETECLAYCSSSDTLMACDDERARRIGKQELGEQRVIGTLALVKMCVQERLLTDTEALRKVEQMKSRGAFLPIVDVDFFGE